MKATIVCSCLMVASTALAIDFNAPIEKVAGDFKFTEGPVWLAAKSELCGRVAAGAVAVRAPLAIELVGETGMGDLLDCSAEMLSWILDRAHSVGYDHYRQFVRLEELANPPPSPGTSIFFADHVPERNRHQTLLESIGDLGLRPFGFLGRPPWSPHIGHPKIEGAKIIAGVVFKVLAATLPA
jgi:hypothetical protein